MCFDDTCQSISTSVPSRAGGDDQVVHVRAGTDLGEDLPGNATGKFGTLQPLRWSTSSLRLLKPLG